MEHEATAAVEIGRSGSVAQVKRFTFGIFEADLSTGELKRSGRRIPSRVNLSGYWKRCWRSRDNWSPAGTSIEGVGSDVVVDFEHGLGNAIKKIRDAIGDSAENPRFIETIAGRGFRFIAPVATLPGSAEPPVGELIEKAHSVQAISTNTDTPRTAADPIDWSKEKRPFLSWNSKSLLVSCRSFKRHDSWSGRPKGTAG